MNQVFEFKSLTFFPIAAQETHFKTNFVASPLFKEAYIKDLKAPLEEDLELNPTAAKMAIHAKHAASVIGRKEKLDSPIDIIGGWDTPRYGFTLEIQLDVGVVRSPRVLVISGYTQDQSLSGNSQLTINSVSTYSVFKSDGTKNILGTFSFMKYVDSFHIHPIQKTGAQYHLQTPSDVYGTFEALELMETYQVVDVRSNVLTHFAPSEKALGIAPYYLSELLNDKVSKDKYCSAYRFIQELTRSGHTTLNDLAFKLGYSSSAVLPYDIDTPEKYVPPAISLYADTNPEKFMGENQHSRHAKTIGAAMSHFITELGVRTINFTIDRREDSEAKMVFHSMDSLFLTTPDTIRKDHLKDFEEVFLKLVMDPITMDGVVPFDLSVDADLNGVTYIGITLDFGPKRYFAYPTFADALLSPVRIDTHDELKEIAKNLQRYSEELKEEEGVKELPWMPGCNY